MVRVCQRIRCEADETEPRKQYKATMRPSPPPTVGLLEGRGSSVVKEVPQKTARAASASAGRRGVTCNSGVALTAPCASGAGAASSS